jgi:ABC-type polysaccharide/polyol phosphate export permease
VIDVARHRDNFLGLEWAMVQQSFMFGIVLLVNVWGGKKSGSIGDPEMA